jgi:ribonuclease E
MKADKARSTVGRISPNGLLEVNRQRLRQALSVRTHQACPTCAGTGRIPSPEMVGLNLLRQIEARAAAGPLGRVRIELHPEYADALQNSRRVEIARLEADLQLRIEVIAAPALHRAEQKLEWFEAPAGEGVREPKKEAEPSVRAWQAGGGPRGERRPPKQEREPAKRRGRGGGRGRGRRSQAEPAAGGAQDLDQAKAEGGRQPEAPPEGAAPDRGAGKSEGQPGRRRRSRGRRPGTARGKEPGAGGEG